VSSHTRFALTDYQVSNSIGTTQSHQMDEKQGVVGQSHILDRYFYWTEFALQLVPYTMKGRAGILEIGVYHK
jgi:hypothetical protein